MRWFLLRNRPEKKKPIADHTQKKKWIPKEANIVDLETKEGKRFATLEVEDNVDNLQLDKEDEINIEIHEKSSILKPTSGSRDSRGVAREGNEIIHNAPIYESELDDDSSETSEFMDATQRLETESRGNSQPTPERIQEDMQFLNESWAALADADEEKIKLQQEALNNSLDDEDI